jgi:hypothetical protein
MHLVHEAEEVADNLARIFLELLLLYDDRAEFLVFFAASREEESDGENKKSEFHGLQTPG